MALVPFVPDPSPPARSVFHQRIRANTEALLSLARVTDTMAQAVEPRVTTLEHGMKHVEHLPHDVKQLGHALNARIDETAKHARDHADRAVAEIHRHLHELGVRVRALEAGQEPGPSIKGVVLFATATNGDGSFDARTDLGQFFLGMPERRAKWTGVGSIAKRPWPGGRDAFIALMVREFAKFSAEHEFARPMDAEDWGLMFDCAPELARTFEAVRPPPPSATEPA